MEPQHEYEKPGYNFSHAYDGLLPEESIDLFTGGLHISQRDVRVQHIKPFDDFEKLITRRYNSKIFRQIIAVDGCHPDTTSVDDEFVGLGWSLHFGRLWDPDSPHPTLELPDGSRHLFTDDTVIPGRKISKSMWILTAGVDPGTGNPFYDTCSPGPDRLCMRFWNIFDYNRDVRGGRTVLHVQGWFKSKSEDYSGPDPQGAHSTVIYARDAAGLLWPKELWELCTDAENGQTGIIFNWDTSSGSPTLQSFEFPWLNGVHVFYTFEYLTQNGHRLLYKFSTPQGKTYQYDYDPVTNELTKLTISTDPTIDSTDLAVEYTYQTQVFKINPFFLSNACTRVVTQKRVKRSDGNYDVWNYQYPSLQDSVHKVIVMEPRGHKREVTYQGYSDSSPVVWNVGKVLKDETFQYESGIYTSLISQSSSYDFKQLSAALDFEASSYDTLKIPVLLQTTVTYPQTSQQVTTSFGSALDFDRYGNPDFRSEFNFNGSLLRKTEYEYSHRDGDSDDTLMEGFHFVRALSRSTVFNSTNQRQSDVIYNRYTNANDFSSFGQISNILKWNNENTGGSCTLPDPACTVGKSYQYDINRQIRQITEDASGGVYRNTYSYPSCGMPGYVYDDMENEAGWLFYSDIDQDPWLYTSTYDPNSGRTDYDYDHDQRLIEIAPPSGDQISINYDDGNRKVIVTQGSASSTEKYDARGRLAEREIRIAPGTSSYQTFSYDALNNPVQESEKSLSPTPAMFINRTFDALNRVTSITTADGTTQFAYNGPDRTVTVQSELGPLVSQFSYDGAGRLISVTEPNGTLSNYTYDSLDRLTGVVQGANTGNPLSRSFTYSSRGKLLSEMHPESGTTTYKYDTFGRLTEKTLSGAVQPTRYSYDLRDRLLNIDYPTDVDVSYYYDGNFSSRPLPGFPGQVYTNPKSHLTGMIDETGTTIWPEFSVREELLQRDIYLNGFLNPLSMSYSYDTRGNLDSLQYPSGQTVRFDRNDANAISSITRQFAPNPETYVLNSIDYNAALLPNQLTYANGVGLSLTSDLRNRPDFFLSAGRLQLDYRYNMRGLIDQIGTSQNGSTFAFRDFSYDSLGRLTNFDSNSGQVSYQYDILGNLLSKSGALSAGPYTYTNNKSDSLIYSSSGNQLAGNGRSFDYNEDNRLKHVTGTNTDVSYLYDGKGNRVKSSDAITGSSRYFVYDETGTLLSDLSRDSSGEVFFDQEFVSGPTGTLATQNYEEMPRAVSVSDADGAVRIQWRNSSNCNVAGFNVYASTTAGGPYEHLNLTGPVTAGVFDHVLNYCDIRYYRVKTALADGTTGTSSVEVRHQFGLLLQDENFDDGVANGFSIAAGTWTVTSSAYNAQSPTNSWAVSLSPTSCSNCVIRVDARNTSKKGGKNAFLVFDYVNSTNFKYAGFDVVAKKWIIGEVISGTRIDRASSARTHFGSQFYDVEVKLESDTRTVTLKNNGAVRAIFTFSSLNSGPVGLAVQNGKSTFDTFKISSGGLPPGSCASSVVDGPFTDYSSPPQYFNLNDHLGTPRVVTNEAGQVTASFEYYPFGEIKSSTGCNSAKQQFTGKLFDQESYLQYFGARYLSNDLTRFTSTDKASSWNRKNPGSWNRYAYSLNDPVNLLDPNGLDAVKAIENGRMVFTIRANFSGPGAANVIMRMQAGLTAKFAGKTVNVDGKNLSVDVRVEGQVVGPFGKGLAEFAAAQKDRRDRINVGNFAESDAGPPDSRDGTYHVPSNPAYQGHFRSDADEEELAHEGGHLLGLPQRNPNTCSEGKECSFMQNTSGTVTDQDLEQMMQRVPDKKNP